MPDFRVLPSIEQLRQREAIAALEHEHGRDATVEVLRRVVHTLRAAIQSGESFADTDAVMRDVETRVTLALTSERKGTLRPVINATGVILHTNLGRAPLAAAALSRLGDVARGYSTLEYDLGEGTRGSRARHTEALLTHLTGAESAVVVNNNAAATLLILAALGAGREVVISRGELVEIGGGFRVPDVMRQSGALLREVGTTNRTRAADYRAAIGPLTALILRVHPSNFTITGFTERASLGELAALARESGVPLVEDLGSGCLLDTVVGEPTVQRSIAAGADVVCFSGDKMLGGPQAGIIVGRKGLIEQVKRHPLMRALRVDKLTLAALEGTLLEYRSGRAATSVPVVRMLSSTAGAIEERARQVVARLDSGHWRAALMSGASTLGGGSAPGLELPTVLVVLQHADYSAAALEERLRQLDPPIIARIEADRVLLDLRTVFPEEDEGLLTALLTL
jgi:L-seryl-tRNA(Ser) seleniumtransferase